MDPEDLGDLVGACLRFITEVANAFDGYVANYFGDGALLYFGYPQAQENDAERAVRAALRIIESAPGLVLPGDYRPQFRIGVATGMVVIGDLIGSAGAAEYDLAGEAPFLATRLQSAAPPGSVFVSAETRRLAGEQFVYRDIGLLTLKGFDRPRRAYQALALTGAVGRFEAHRGEALQPLIGRQEEFAALSDYWQEAKAGRGQVVVLSGEAGIGKSRLAVALAEKAGQEEYSVLRYYCARQQTASPFQPVIDQISQVCGITAEDRRSFNLTKINRLLVGRDTKAEDLLLVADLLSMLPPDSRGVLPEAPMRRREMTKEALLRLVKVVAHRRPTLAIFEDIHWADPSSLELLQAVVERLDEYPLLLLVTTRPEFRPGWHGPDVHHHQLGPLKGEDCAALMRSLVGDSALPEEIVETIIERADGVPLFVEELTKAVAEAVEGGGRGRADDPACLGVPITLQASLTERLDRLGEIKHVLQIAAALGREFPAELLAALTGMEQPKLEEALQRLASAGLLLQLTGPSRGRYAFRHALLQEAAFASMLRGTQRSLHARIVTTLEQEFAESAEERPELLAYHAAEGGLTEKAVGYWLKAGKQAFARSAILEAIARLERGLQLVSGLPPGAARHQLELDISIALAKSHIATTGYTSPETYRAIERARALCDMLGGPIQLPAVINGQWAYSFIGNEIEAASERAGELLKIGEARNDRVSQLLGHRSTGLTAFVRGDFLDARLWLEKGIELYRPEDQPIYVAFAVEDACVVMTSYLSWVLIYLGHFEEGRQARERALQEARASGHALSVAHALNGYAFTELLLGAPEGALEPLAELERVNEEHALTYYRAFVHIFRGLACSQLGESDRGLSLIEQGIDLYTAGGSRVYLPVFHRWLASSYRRAGRLAEAEAELERAQHIAASSGAFGDEGEMWRVRGELFEAKGAFEEAERSYRIALDVAAQREAMLWTLRAATGLTRLLDRQGRFFEARQLLDGTCAWFRDENAPPELQAARSLLKRVA